MIRLLLTSLYSILILILSGLADLAFAATSCQEQIAPEYTTYRYADALTRFIHYNGKTYAIAKSAVSGLTTGADAYFNFTASIDWRYRTTGQDVSSLKSLLAMGRYGDARPVSIPDAATRDWIVARYSDYLGTATSSQSTYVDAWKEFGIGVPFTHFDGSTLPFTSWPINGVPNVATITAPHAVVMGSDGIWRNGEEAVRTSQIVELDGKLDCATDLTPPVTPVPVPPPPGTPPVTICTQDINGDGDIDASESAPCVQTPQGWFCPVGSVPCDNQSCTQGTYNPVTQMCEWTTVDTTNPVVENSCPSGWNLNGSNCYANCSYSIYSSSSGTTSTYSCINTGSGCGSFDASCFWTSQGLAPGGYKHVPGGRWYTDYYNTSPVPSIVAATVINACPTGYTLSGTICTRTTFHQTPSTVLCPLGSQYSCMDNNGTLACSPNQCFDPVNPPGGTVETNIDDDTMLQDDARNPDGSCAGSIIIFNGKASRCRPPGLSVGYINNCCESDEVMTEDTGNQIMTATTAIRTMYQLGMTAYYTYQMYTGAMTLAQASQIVSTASEAVVSGVQAAATAMQAGASMAEGMTSAMSECLAGMINPATIAVAIVVMVVMKVLFGGGCDAGDIQTAAQAKSNQCHYIGGYCERHIFSGCVQRARSYCCFNSMMARIIHEQGRPQLTAFGTSGVWGTPEAPNCRGFTPDEFQALDFARIDLSEYYGVIQQNLAAKVQNTQNKINQTIQNRVNQINP